MTEEKIKQLREMMERKYAYNEALLKRNRSGNCSQNGLANKENCPSVSRQNRTEPPHSRVFAGIDENNIEPRVETKDKPPLEPCRRKAKIEKPDIIKTPTAMMRSKSAGSGIMKDSSKDATISSPPKDISIASTSLLRHYSSFSSLDTKKVIEINGKTYLELMPIGKGGTCTVTAMYDEEKKEVVAVKCVQLGDDETIKSAYINEVELLRSLQGSPFVIKMFDFEIKEQDNLLYVVMERGDVDLNTILKDRRAIINSTFIRYHWMEMLRCVKVIHDRNIVHADLKPANFLLVKGTLKLIDFGIASSIPVDSTAAWKDSKMGTLSYMSPEILEDEGQEGKYKLPLKTDVWSLGCILYYMVYGHLPFSAAKSQVAKISAICNEKYQIQFPECGNDLLVDTLKRCLVRDYHKRADVDELLAHPYLNDDSSVTHSTSSIFGPSTPTRSAVFMKMAREMQNNTPNTLAKKLEEFSLSMKKKEADPSKTPVMKLQFE